ncbi:hypothetical protein PHJA_000037000 [Phtheirospermum japonicum]|uniref:Uncharacterized protein n=1 Tax=Phtheirospermum japonicum TaxID=374723 RepID=A0A830B411_9LAMI|nr:hypothetical protein PHJA_000037000 [Phtheirospermum japonicum]
MKTIDFLTIFLILSSVLFAIEARRLDIRFPINGVKSGPSPGDGHKYTNANTIGGIKNSGPSPGAGNKHTNDANTIGGIKNSGPSPGDGH